MKIKIFIVRIKRNNYYYLKFNERLRNRKIAIQFFFKSEHIFA